MRRVALGIASGLLFIGGCTVDGPVMGDDPDPTPPPTSQATPSTASESQSVTPAGLGSDGVVAWERWRQQGLRSYRYALTVGCFCPSLLDVEVVIRDGEVVSLDGEPFKEGDIVTGFRESPPTIEDLFTVLGHWQSAADSVSVDYDSDTGVPISIQVDSERNAIDDEISYRVENLESIDSASSLP